MEIGILFKKHGKVNFMASRHGFLLPSLFKPGTWFKPGTCFAGMTVTAVFQLCHSWLDQESRMRNSIVTMKYKEDTEIGYFNIKNIMIISNAIALIALDYRH
ncbi:MAG: hypothetical protein HQL04_00045 [Nitrospirae bacterium]|nr:hypothetical protein [Nitrospirota bacterium]